MEKNYDTRRNIKRKCKKIFKDLPEVYLNSPEETIFVDGYVEGHKNGFKEGFSVGAQARYSVNFEQVEKEHNLLTDIIEAFQSQSLTDDGEMADTAREIAEILGIKNYR